MRLPGAWDSGSNVLSSTLEDCELSINWFPESGQVGTPKVGKYHRRRPGLRFLFSAGDQPVGGMFYLDGRAFFVAGTSFCEQFDDDTFVVRGTVAFDGIDQPTMCSNGSAGDQVFVTAGSNGYIFTLSTNAFAIIADPDFPNGTAVMGEFFAGYFFVLTRNSRRVQWSALEDGTDWDPLDVFERSWAPDNISFIKRNGTHIWCVGTQTSEVLYATGDITVFGPAQESLIEHGCIARFSGQLTAQGVACLDQDARGGGQVVLFRGLQPDAISTYAINLELIQAADPTHPLFSLFAFVVQMEGHAFYVLNSNFATENLFRYTPVFDATEQLWHHWAHWDENISQWFPFRGSTHMFAYERHFIGDRLTGAVYELSFDQLSDELADVA